LVSGGNETTGGFSGVETRRYLLSVQELRRGKSQECCEHETRLTRIWREKTVKRVAKP
jgi:hypothetical protein